MKPTPPPRSNLNLFVTTPRCSIRQRCVIASVNAALFQRQTLRVCAVCRFVAAATIKLFSYRGRLVQAAGMTTAGAEGKICQLRFDSLQYFASSLALGEIGVGIVCCYGDLF
jgi:hypothetical protein